MTQKQKDELVFRKNAGMIDYDLWKKGLVRIGVRAQEKLGGINKENLQAKLDKEASLRQEAEEQKKKAHDKFKREEDKKKEEMNDLKKQYEEE